MEAMLLGIMVDDLKSLASDLAVRNAVMANRFNLKVQKAGNGWSFVK